MSQKVKSQIIEKACEGCGAVKEYELVESTDETVEALQNYYTVIREILVPTPQGMRFQKFMVQACSLACVPAAAVKLALPKQEQEEPEIDLASLRSDPTVN